MISMNLSNIAILNVNGPDFRCINLIPNMNLSEKSGTF